MYASDTVTRLLDLLLARPDWDLLQASALKLIANLTQDGTRLLPCCPDPGRRGARGHRPGGCPP